MHRRIVRGTSRRRMSIFRPVILADGYRFAPSLQPIEITLKISMGSAAQHVETRHAERQQRRQREERPALHSPLAGHQAHRPTGETYRRQDLAAPPAGPPCPLEQTR
ncbi:hypothetical protein ACFFYR_24470 [Paraburkholderia dipogonis]|uniref:hypothetical protein n=1 Tax=Paraburkholderia dipogonis TaxID=1211383 RepID=UPI0035EEF329